MTQFINERTGESTVKMKVYRKGSSAIGYIPTQRVYRVAKKAPDDTIKAKRAAFRRYYLESLNKTISKHQRIEFLFQRMLNNEPVSYLLDKEEIKKMLKYEINRVYKIKKRYADKLGWFRPNWFVTFTYDSKITDEKSFEKKLIRCLNNLAYRNSWKAIGAPEFGSKGERKHFHFMCEIPEGQMVGELFGDKKYNVSKKKWEFFNNNTFFQERFGICHFERISGDNLSFHRLSNYLTKYITKQDGRLIYIGRVSTFVEMDVSEENIFMTTFDFTRKFYLDLKVIYNDNELKYLDTDSFYFVDNEGMGLNLNVSYKQPACPLECSA